MCVTWSNEETRVAFRDLVEEFDNLEQYIVGTRPGCTARRLRDEFFKTYQAGDKYRALAFHAEGLCMNAINWFEIAYQVLRLVGRQRMNASHRDDTMT
jgi:hypothetical protein